MSQESSSADAPTASPEGAEQAPGVEPDEARGDDPAGTHGTVGGEPLTSGPLTDAFGSLVSVLLRRGRRELGRRAATGRVRLDLRMLRRDRDQMYQKLGREVRALVEGDEVQHPGLRRGVDRIVELEERIATVEAGLSDVPPDPAEAADPEGKGEE